jgi:hypothetical protein
MGIAALHPSYELDTKPGVHACTQRDPTARIAIKAKTTTSIYGEARPDLAAEVEALLSKFGRVASQAA